MDIFNIHLNILKMIGFSKYPSDRMKKVNGIIIFLNYFANIFCCYGYVKYCLKSTDILETVEILSMFFTSFETIIKYTVFYIYAEDFFEAMDDICFLNEKCKESSY